MPQSGTGVSVEAVDPVFQVTPSLKFIHKPRPGFRNFQTQFITLNSKP